MIRHRRSATDRLQQVWFTGMHADVGGGYPDESLSYVSLLWMMEEAEKAGLRTLTGHQGSLRRARQQLRADPRQPRGRRAPTTAISRARSPPGSIRSTPQTLSLRDPAIVDADGRPQGLLRSVKVHESVINRIAHGTDRYAPITLPQTFEVFPPQAEGENVPQADSVAERRRRLGRQAEPVATPFTAAGEPGAPNAAGRDADARARGVRRGLGSRLATARRLLHHRRLHAAAGDDAHLDLRVSTADPGGRPHLDRCAAPRPGTAAARGVPAGSTPSRTTRSTSWCSRSASGSRMRYGARCERRLRDRARHIWQAAADDRRAAAPSQPRRAAWRGSATRRATSAGCRCSSGGCCPTSCSCPSSCSWRCGSAPGASPRPTCRGWRVARRCARAPADRSRARHDVRGDVPAERHLSRRRCHGREGPALPRGAAGGRSRGSTAATPRPDGPARARPGPGRHPGRAVPARHRGQLPAAVVEIRQPPRAWRFDNVYITPLALAEQEPRPLRRRVQGRRTTASCSSSPTTPSALHDPTYFYQSRPGRNHGTAALSIVRLEEAPVATAPQPEPQRAEAGGHDPA